MFLKLKLKLLILCFVLELKLNASSEVPKIGIIGGGIGGTSCAFFLKSLMGKNKIIIDLFEAEKIGGRVSSVNFSDMIFEEGGSIIHSSNKYMLSFLKAFNLNKRQTPQGYFALYDGQDFVFSESNWQLKTLWDVIYRYGFGFWKLKSYIDDMLCKFERIYKLQESGEFYETVTSLLAAMDPKFVDFLHISTKSGFSKQGMSEIVVNEIIMASILANYGQNLSIQKMVGSVSVAGAVGDLWSVDGGNVKIPENLVKASSVKLIQRQVTTVKKLPSGKFEIYTKGGNEKDFTKYNVVILATPQTTDSKYQIEFVDFNQEIKFVGKYHTTVCTLVKGRLSEQYFPQKSPLTDEILTVKEGLLFNSIGKITPVDYKGGKFNQHNIWKIFTQRRLEWKEISSLFSQVENIYVREWLAYPHYSDQDISRNDSFVVAPNLYHINAIEWAASAMEMSAVAAKNVALLVYNNLMSNKNYQRVPSWNSKKIDSKEEL